MPFAQTLFADESSLTALSNFLKVVVAVGITGLLLATWWLASRYYRTELLRYKRKAKEAEEARDTAVADEQQASHLLAAAHVQLSTANGKLHFEQQCRHAAEQDRDTARNDVKTTQVELSLSKDRVTELTKQNQQLQNDVIVLRQKSGLTDAELTAKTRALGQLEKRMKAALKLEGQLWNAKAHQKRPRFREMSCRKRAIISVLNLKGGVGKTTVSAHLGAALARKGYRVLLVDLDLQGSLTNLLLPQDKVNQAYADKRLVQHFFQRASEDKTTKITEYTVEVFQTGSGGALDLVGASDNLAYAELNLTMRWLMGTGERDTRFLLRKALHLMGVTAQYDIVLIDCPPLVNISCVNALAASDYVLVPTTLSRKSLERAPKLIQKVLRNEKFVKYINPKLHLLGLLANRTHGHELTGPEETSWEQAASWCKDAYGHEVTQFVTHIPRNKAIDDSKTVEFAEGTDKYVDGLFAELTHEIEGKLPSECRRATGTPL